MNHHEPRVTGRIIGHIILVVILGALGACTTTPRKDPSTEIAAQPENNTPEETDPTQMDWFIITKDQAEDMGLGSWLVGSDRFYSEFIFER